MGIIAEFREILQNQNFDKSSSAGIPESRSSGRPRVPEFSDARLRESHREILRRVIIGQKNVEIAKDLGRSPQSITIIVNSPLFQSELRRLRGKIDEGFVRNIAEVDKRVSTRIRLLAEPSVNALEKILEDHNKKLDGSDRLRKETAVAVLELAGHGKRKSDYVDGMNDFAKFVTDAFNQAQSAKGAKDAKDAKDPVEVAKNVTDIKATEVPGDKIISAGNLCDTGNLAGQVLPGELRNGYENTKSIESPGEVSIDIQEPVETSMKEESKTTPEKILAELSSALSFPKILD